MKKAFIVLMFFAVLSLLSTLYPISSIEDARERLHTEQTSNKVVNSSWPWLPMIQLDKYRSLFDIDNKTP